MQLNIQVFEQPKKESLKSENPKLRITSRDLAIFEFLLEMKFATVEELHSRFFKNTRDGNTSESLWWARERLQELRREDLIQATTLLTDRRNYFLPTIKSYRLLSRKFPEREFPRPLAKIELNTFEHDYKVLQMRLYLESHGMIKSWISERQLQVGRESRAFTHRDAIPDGIYTLKNDEEFIFELEISLKSLKRYRAKIKRFVEDLRSSGADKRKRTVLFVCAKESVLQILKNETRIYGELFKVQSITEFFQSHNFNQQGK